MMSSDAPYNQKPKITTTKAVTRSGPVVISSMEAQIETKLGISIFDLTPTIKDFIKETGVVVRIRILFCFSRGDGGGRWVNVLLVVAVW